MERIAIEEGQPGTAFRLWEKFDFTMDSQWERGAKLMRCVLKMLDVGKRVKGGRILNPEVIQQIKSELEQQEPTDERFQNLQDQNAELRKQLETEIEERIEMEDKI